jgi:hypothetical protein
VEFQPSSWDRGSYLNVAAKWLWRPTKYWTFDYSPDSQRASGFQRFVSEKQFSGVALELAHIAADRAARLRHVLATIDLVADRLEATATVGGWNLYHAGMSAFLAGRQQKAQALFRELGRPTDADGTSGPWLDDLRATAREFAHLAHDPVNMLARIDALVKESRSALRLPPWDGELPKATSAV